MTQETSRRTSGALAEAEAQPGPSWLSPGWRRFFTFILGIVFFLSFLGFLLGLVVQRHLLDPDLYAGALAENNVYERLYTEVLADPAVQQQVAEITGINIDLIVGEAYA